MRNGFISGTFAVVMIFPFFMPELGHVQTIVEGGPQSFTDYRVSKVLPDSKEQIQQGKALYEGVAGCIHCHGRKALRRSLTEQQPASVIKFGVAGTAHMPFQYLLSDEEIWAIVYYQIRETRTEGSGSNEEA